MESFEFSSVLFNFHDVILLMTAMQCLFCFLLLCITSDRNVKSTLFLALFLLAHALIPMNELMMWGAEFKVTVRNLFPTLYLLFQLAGVAPPNTCTWRLRHQTPALASLLHYNVSSLHIRW